VESAAFSRPKPGEDHNGDAYIDVDVGDFHLSAVVDGLGHGKEACEASDMAVEIIAANAESDLSTLMDRLHKGLRGSRGAVAALMRFEENGRSMQYIGLGNIDMHSTNPEIRPISYGGILGHNWRKPKLFSYQCETGDLFVMFSDGITSRFDLGAYKEMRCEDIVKLVVSELGKDHDDATALAVRA